MIGFKLIFRRQAILHKTKVFFVAYSNINKNNPPSSSSSSSSSSSDDESTTKRKQKSEEARKKLNLLLDQMIQDDTTSTEKSTLEFARARSHRQKDIRTEPGTDSVETKPLGEKVAIAVKEVAEAIGGDTKQTESELLQKLLHPSKEESTQRTSETLSALFKDMRIDREPKPGQQLSRADQVKQLIQSAKVTKRIKGIPGRKLSRADIKSTPFKIDEERVNLSGDECLGIFPHEEVVNWEERNLNKTWKILQERELSMSVTHPPANYFQEMILWTEQKKLWRFPIDNEQDIDESQKVSFTEHIFLEKHLEPWCPPKGPIRHFMELVCVGLSKNPYLTVDTKKEHIEWFKNYFYEKKQLLQEVGAIPPGFSMENCSDMKV